MQAGFVKADAQGLSHDASALEILASAGVTPRFVAGSSHNPKVTEASDLKCVEALLERLA